jgi:hypothetical protein
MARENDSAADVKSGEKVTKETMFQAENVTKSASSAFEASGRAAAGAFENVGRGCHRRGRGVPQGRAGLPGEARSVLPGERGREPSTRPETEADPVARGFRRDDDRAHARPHRPHDRTGERTRRGEPSGHAKRCRRACSPATISAVFRRARAAPVSTAGAASDCRMSLMGRGYCPKRMAR